ncbi:MAG: hypothetical protein ACM3KR_06475 [Deltaproteobacteria bacterium]
MWDYYDDDYYDDRQFIPPIVPGFDGFPSGGEFEFPPGIGGGMQGPMQQPPGMPQGGTGMGMNAPPGPPPAMIPAKPHMPAGAVFAVDPGAIAGCLYRFTVIYPRFGRPFWAWLIFVGPRSAAGFRWNGFSWRFFGIDLNLIDYFQCV